VVVPMSLRSDSHRAFDQRTEERLVIHHWSFVIGRVGK